jgi:Lsr2
MAKQVITSLIDDIDGKPASQTIEFGLDGVSYSIDLSDKNADKLRSVLHPFIGRVPSSGRRGAARTGGLPARTSRDQTAAIREWAAKAGHEISNRGRIPARIVAAYEEAHRR